ncbi:hypothetical protein SAMN05428987_1686 [Paenibacillus sp. CF095]|uniref:hypothetical protein n=1 Tax=Paenibacillus sp. CF095 TaxID=1881033 RepID=UPI00088F1536|nr:hypothetical protein [Paenibacillus sp. CF095]SDC53673.1 hypothetical protein SAMN05428987_1686 [Paenibacillus sp. CF095]
MAKREQVEKTVHSIAQAQADYEQLMEEIRGYCLQVKQLREQAVHHRNTILVPLQKVLPKINRC